jgi:hypothetical protein
MPLNKRKVLKQGLQRYKIKDTFAPAKGGKIPFYPNLT